MSQPSYVHELVERFSLDAEPSDRAEVITSLKARLSKLHPDKTGGQFTSEEDKQQFFSIQAALAKLEDANDSALVPLEHVTALVETLAKAVAPMGAVQNEMLQAQRKQEIRNQVRARYAQVKVTSGTFLAISTAILTFMGTLKDNPVLGDLLTVPNVPAYLAAIWLTSCVLFAMTWLRERKAAATAEYLTTENGLGRAFGDLCRHIRERGDGNFVFSRRDYVEMLASPWMGSVERIFGSSLDHATAEPVVTVHIERLLDRGAIKRQPRKGVLEWFEVDEEILAEAAKLSRW
ncbi:hypothetical protein J2X04_000949 [Lysobacter niabensis]|uniref:J domain-containing protein n=1 Tax=Agrilutibacter niabensis TaxID=380628 RepID=A0ABU1VMA4_9GAMM|nr:hypothetical protein [Lysobacter niabensis]MDR7098602.1 hypothetical protein [Lysobacter niabensis]